MAARRIHWFRIFLFAVPIAVAGALLIEYFLHLYNQQPASWDSQPSAGGRIHATPFLMAGLDRPQTVAAKDAKVADDEDVIGVVVNGRTRAYRVTAFHGMTNHVVNDVIDAVPVTVTYCDENNCVQAFTGPKRGQPLDIWVGGWNQQMILKTGGTYFWQSTGKSTDADRPDEMPFPTFPFERLSWKAWRSIYPNTDVYVGQ
jgi:hypothetical protein